jgi:arsenate reductase-like glutaredoxin family protein
MRFFGLKTCDTCRKALASLRAGGHAPEVRDVRADGVAEADLSAVFGAFGDAAVNRASTTWRGLDDGERALPVVELLARHPTLMKRPAIERDGVWTLGWDKAVQARYGV